MELSRDGHEVLAVAYIETGSQVAIVRTHHTMYAHVQAAAADQVAVGADLNVSVMLVTWDTADLITDQDLTLDVMVDGQVVDQVTTVAGRAEVVLQFSDPGPYTIEIRADTVNPAVLEVTVQ